MTLLFTTPTIYTLPLIKGEDLVIDWEWTPDGVAAPYDVDVTVRLVIDSGPVVVVVDDVDTIMNVVTAEAVIIDTLARTRVESDICDQIAKDKTWRVIVTFPTDPLTDRVAANGLTARFDGKTPPS